MSKIYKIKFRRQDRFATASVVFVHSGEFCPFACHPGFRTNNHLLCSYGNWSRVACTLACPRVPRVLHARSASAAYQMGHQRDLLFSSSSAKFCKPV